MAKGVKCDLIGKTFGYLTVLEKLEERSKFKQVQWRCVCKCGNEKIVPTGNLTSGNTTCCGKTCIYCQDKKYHKGDKINGYEVVDYAHKNGLYICKCQCGKLFKTNDWLMSHNISTSCGCNHKQKNKDVIKEKNPFGYYDGTHITNLKSILKKEGKSNSKTGHIGVERRVRKNGWVYYVAYIQYQKKKKHLGSFDHIEDAIMARRIAEDKYFKNAIHNYESEKECEK